MTPPTAMRPNFSQSLDIADPDPIQGHTQPFDTKLTKTEPTESTRTTMTTEQTTLDLCAELEALKHRLNTAERRFRALGGAAFVAVLGAVFLAPGNRAAIAQGYGLTLQQLAARITADEGNITNLQTRAAALEGKTQFMTASASGKSTTFTGCNLYIQNGLGVTNGNPNDPSGTGDFIVNGLGNLILGYNVTGRITIDPFTGLPLPDDVRTGSHNLILGDFNNYSSFGGIVAGQFSTVSGAYATVTGGQGNSAANAFASVSGGSGNLASGANSSVSGGASNVAAATYASISGGANNLASNLYASVSGGNANTASGRTSTVSGGSSIIQGSEVGWSGGSFHTP
jgi:hypothetical protein